MNDIDFQQLLEDYWDAAYAEGTEGRTHDTEEGVAQQTLNAINAYVESLRQQLKEWKNLSDELMMRLGQVEEELAALKQSHGEPVAWINKKGDFCCVSTPSTVYGSHTIPLYTAPIIPEGWQIVPIEPTDKMREFICDCYCDGQIDTYKSMLAAAPKPWDV